MIRIGNKIRKLAEIPSIPEHDFYDLVYLFAAGGVLGTIYEVLQYLLINGVLEDRRGSILTPANYVYALGAVAMFLVLHRMKRPFTVFTVGAFLGGAVEYILSLLQEYVLGSRSWDYAGRPLNINGRTTIPYMLVWGVLCFLAMRFVFTALLRCTHRIPPGMRKRIAICLLILFAADVLITVPAVVRYAQRAKGIFFDNGLINLIDRVFDDAFMGVHFPNMALK